MTTWDDLRTARRQGSLAAQRARRRLGLAATRRVDIFDVIDMHDVWLMFQPLRDLYGFYRRLDDDRAGIVLHAGHPLGVQRYTAAHELAHHLLGHGFSLDRAADVSGALGADEEETTGVLAARTHVRDDVGDPLQEAAAQEFAATFLMPIQAINQALIEAGHDRDHPALSAPDIYDLSLGFGTSYEAMLTQLAVLDKVAWANVKGLRLPPIQIKTRLAGRKPLDSRADLWVVRDRNRESALTLRVGDEVLIQLPEIPSSGYGWELELPNGAGVEVLDDRIDAIEAEPVLGGASQHTFHLHVTAVGPIDLALRLVRPWEEDPADRTTIRVDVAEAPTGEAATGLLAKQQRRRAQAA